MRVLLLVDYNPERITAHLIEDVGSEQLRVLEAANGRYIGSDDLTPEMDLVSRAITNPSYYEGFIEGWSGVWIDCAVDFPVKVPVDAVFLYGVCI